MRMGSWYGLRGVSSGLYWTPGASEKRAAARGYGWHAPGTAAGSRCLSPATAQSSSLSGRLQFTVRRHKFNQDSLSITGNEVKQVKQHLENTRHDHDEPSRSDAQRRVPTATDRHPPIPVLSLTMISVSLQRPYLLFHAVPFAARPHPKRADSSRAPSSLPQHTPCRRNISTGSHALETSPRNHQRPMERVCKRDE